MQVSLRSHVVAGVAAVVGAGLVTAAPSPHVPALPSTANVALAGLDNPLTEIIATANMVQNYLFAGYYNGKEAPTPGAGEANWPYAGLDQTGGIVLNYLYAREKGLGLYTNVGLLPWIVNANEPILNQLQVNWLGYLNTALSGAAGAATAATEGVWNFPAAAVEAAKLAVNGDVQAAFQTLVDAIVTPAATALSDLAGAAATVVRSVVAKLGAVIAVIPTNLQLFGGWLFRGGAYLVQKAVATATQWVQELGAGNFEGAWNTAVDGLLGPSGLPGAAFNVSLGAGVQTGPILSEADIKANYIPSLRTAIQATVWNTQEALTASAPPMVTPPAASTPAAAVAESPAALDTPETAVDAPKSIESTPAEFTPAESTPADAVTAAPARRGLRAATSNDAPVKAHRATRASRAGAGNG